MVIKQRVAQASRLCEGKQTIPSLAGKPERLDSQIPRSNAMGMDFSVAVNQGRLPSVDAVCQKARDYGYPIELPKIDWSEHADEVLGVFDGEEASFYFHAEHSSEFEEIAEALELSPSELFGDRDIVLTLRPDLESAGLQLALVVSAALVELCDGVFFDDFDNVDRTPERILAEVASLLEETDD